MPLSTLRLNYLHIFWHSVYTASSCIHVDCRVSTLECHCKTEERAKGDKLKHLGRERRGVNTLRVIYCNLSFWNIIVQLILYLILLLVFLLFIFIFHIIIFIYYIAVHLLLILVSRHEKLIYYCTILKV